MKYNLKKLVKKALVCDKHCGHSLKSINSCFEHQVERIKDLIEIEADTWEVSRPFAIRPRGWRMGQTLFSFLRWLNLKKHCGIYQENILADTFNLSDEKLDKLYAKFLKENE